MNRLVLLRLTWGLLALPLALIALVAILAMWPAVFTNAPLNLLAIAYVLLLPLLPVFWSGKRPRIVIGLALATTVVQWCLFAILNRWF